MHWSGYCQSLGLFTLACAFVFIFRRLFLHPLSSFPGPKLAATFSFVHFYVLWTGREKTWYRQLHEKYGPVVRCGPNHLSFNDPDLIPVVYHRQTSKTEYPKDFTCPAAATNKAHYDEYAAAKRKFGMAFSPSRVQTYEGPIDDTFVEWIKGMRGEAEQNPVLDWTTWVTYFGLDMYTKISLGKSFGFIAAKSDVEGLIKSSYRVYKRWTLSRNRLVLWLAENTIIGRRLLVSGPEDMKGMGRWTNRIHKAIQTNSKESNVEQPGSWRPMLDQWLAAKSTDGKTIPVPDIEDQLVSDILGGSAAAGGTIHFIATEMAAHHGPLRRAQEEIDQAFATGKLTDPVPTSVECLALPYVHACMREIMRINATSSPRWRASLDRSLPLGDRIVPPGVAIATSPYTICTSPKIWGKDADEFLPVRWLEATEEQLRIWDRYDSHWGFGYRKCPGRFIGTMLMSKSIVMILRHFDLEQITPGSMLPLKMTPRME